MTRYRVKVWCGDCHGSDFAGCFDGGVEYSEETYETKELAQAAADEMEIVDDGAPYEYRVVEAP